MKTTRPELGFERLLMALERDLLDASDEEIMAVATELGLKPHMKGSIALFGVTAATRLKDWGYHSKPKIRATADRPSTGRSRRRSKDDAP